MSKSLSQAQLDQPLTAEDRDRVLSLFVGLARSTNGANTAARYGAVSTRRDVRPAPLARPDLFGGIPPFYVADRLVVATDDDAGRRRHGSSARGARGEAREPDHLSRRGARRSVRASEASGWGMRMPAADCSASRPTIAASTIPPPVLSGIEKDLSQPAQSAIAAAKYDGAGKIGLQFKRRFWEQDDDIYGGRSWTDQEVGQIIYPSHGLTTAKGVIVGYYLDFRGTMRGRPHAEIQRLALEHGARIHPQ